MSNSSSQAPLTLANLYHFTKEQQREEAHERGFPTPYPEPVRNSSSRTSLIIAFAEDTKRWLNATESERARMYTKKVSVTSERSKESTAETHDRKQREKTSERGRSDDGADTGSQRTPQPESQTIDRPIVAQNGSALNTTDAVPPPDESSDVRQPKKPEAVHEPMSTKTQQPDPPPPPMYLDLCEVMYPLREFSDLTMYEGAALEDMVKAVSDMRKRNKKKLIVQQCEEIARTMYPGRAHHTLSVEERLQVKGRWKEDRIRANLLAKELPPETKTLAQRKESLRALMHQVEQERKLSKSDPRWLFQPMPDTLGFNGKFPRHLLGGQPNEISGPPENDAASFPLPTARPLQHVPHNGHNSIFQQPARGGQTNEVSRPPENSAGPFSAPTARPSQNVPDDNDDDEFDPFFSPPTEKPPLEDDKVEKPPKRQPSGEFCSTLSDLFPPDFPRFWVAQSLNDVAAYLANASYVISLGGAPVPDLKYGIITVPLGQEKLLFDRSSQRDTMTPEFLQAVRDARYFSYTDGSLHPIASGNHQVYQPLYQLSSEGGDIHENYWAPVIDPGVGATAQRGIKRKRNDDPIAKADPVSHPVAIPSKPKSDQDIPNAVTDKAGTEIAGAASDNCPPTSKPTRKATRAKNANTQPTPRTRESLRTKASTLPKETSSTTEVVPTPKRVPASRARRKR